jgi:perosamine synthetase
MDERAYDGILDFIRSLYPGERPVPLHAPRFLGNEKRYLADCVDTTIVSYVGGYVTELESHVRRLTGARCAVALVNGTVALQMALEAAGVRPGDLVVTQDLTFAATAAAACHAGAVPAFVDVDRDTLGMSPSSLAAFLAERGQRGPAGLTDRGTGRRIGAVVPMHTFGHAVRVREIAAICAEAGLPLVEDAAEAIGSTLDGRHLGTFGAAGILSFNGNKPVTTGGGGMLVTDDEALAERVRHGSTTAKVKHPWEFFHDAAGHNYRMPNVNAALGCAQMEYFPRILRNKRATAEAYRAFCASAGVPFVAEPPGAASNYWLNAILADDRADRDRFLAYSNGQGVQTRPAWILMHRLPPYRDCPRGPVPNAEWLEDRVVNLPSSYRFVDA